jgi:hypothetical protein
MASLTVVIFSAASSGISTPNSSSNAMTSSTMSRLSAPRSSMKLASSVTFSASTPRCSTTIFFTRSAVSLISTLSFRETFGQCVSEPPNACQEPNPCHEPPLPGGWPMSPARPLTRGEIEMARSMFGDSIDYES